MDEYHVSAINAATKTVIIQGVQEGTDMNAAIALYNQDSEVQAAVVANGVELADFRLCAVRL